MNARLRDDHGLGQLRLPPQAPREEQAVLGGLMLAGLRPGDYAQRVWAEVSEIVDEDSFYRRDHQLIFRAIRELIDKGRPFDCLSVGEWFETMRLNDQVDGGAYLVEVSSTTPSVANIRAYAQTVADKALRRRLIEAGTEMVNDGFDGSAGETIEIIGRAQTRVGSLLNSQPSEVAPMSDAMTAAFAELNERHDRGEGMDGIPTGFDDLDEILGGLVPGVHFIAGRPKHGKSTLAQNLAEYVALRLGKPVHIVILEMSSKQYAKRVIASIGHVDSQRMRRGTLDDFDWANVSNAVSRAKGAPLFISKPGKTRVEHICAQIRKQHARTPLGLAVVDYLQLVEIVTQRGENYSVAVGRVTRALVNLSQEIGVPILVLSQLSREAEKEGRPKPSHLRDSGSIEADAESVIFVYREEMNDPKSKWAGTVEVIVALNRNGPGGSCRLKFNGAQYRCENLPPDWAPAEPDPEPRGERRPTGFRRSGADAAAGASE